MNIEHISWLKVIKNDKNKEKEISNAPRIIKFRNYHMMSNQRSSILSKYLKQTKKVIVIFVIHSTVTAKYFWCIKLVINFQKKKGFKLKK